MSVSAAIGRTVLCNIAASVWVTLAAVGFGGSAAAQTPPANSAAQAEAAVARGLAMAQQKQWGLANRYFRQAHQLSPTHPAILLNLGLANDRSGGRELIAAAWYRAFMASAPDARNAQQVSQRVTEIEIAAETQVQQLIGTALRVAGETETAAERSKIYGAAMRAQAASGDVSAMRRTQSLAPGKEDADWALAITAALKAWTDTSVLVKSEASAIASPQQQSWALAEVAVAFARRGRMNDAISTGREIKNRAEAAYALSRIAVLRARVNDVAGARAAIEQIDAARHPAEHAIARAELASALARGRDGAAATELAAAEGALRDSKDAKSRGAAETQIAVARILVNGGAGADAEITRLPDGAPRYRALKVLASMRDDPQAAEIFRWTVLALDMEEVPALAELGATIEAAKARSPAESGLVIARAAEDQARYLMRFRYAD